ncbi:MAG TPA: zinc ribbon domain-containing protein [Ignavibacteriaceae bacterium]|nr:zinc ribbon domain-containing protein [Ignavibacteriaceae bacterium]
MPLFEYRCAKCSIKFEVLHKSSIKLEEVICPGCHSTDVKKLISNFSSAVYNSSSSGESCSNGNCQLNNYGQCASGLCGME